MVGHLKSNNQHLKLSENESPQKKGKQIKIVFDNIILKIAFECKLHEH